MRVLLVSSVFYPDRAGTAAISTDAAFALSERGHDVTVRCGYPHYPEWKDKSGMNGLGIERTVLKGVTVERFGLWIPPRPNSLGGRLLQEASFFASLVRRCGTRQFDVVLVFCPLLSAAGYALVGRLLSATKVVVNVQDIPAEAAVSGGFVGPRLGGVFRWLQAKVLGRCDAVCTISDRMKQQLDRDLQGHPEVRVVPNWLTGPTAEVIARTSVPTPSRRLRPRLLYAGNLGAKQGMLELVRVLHESAADFEFEICGDGAQRVELSAWLEHRADPRFALREFLPLDEFVKKVLDCDWFVIPEVGGSAAPFFPSKLVSVIALGRPIVAICDADGPLGTEVQEGGLGLVVGWKDVGSLMEKGLGSPEPYSAPCAARAVHYSREAATGHLERLLLAQTRPRN